MVAMVDEWGRGSPPLHRQQAAQSSVAAMPTTHSTAQQSLPGCRHWLISDSREERQSSLIPSNRKR
jgi:hypothetical protein